MENKVSRITLLENGPILEITMDHAPANAIDQQASRDLAAAFNMLRDRKDLRVAIVTGGGERMFSAGWDLKAVANGDIGEDFGGYGFMGLTERFDLNKPVIAAINGLAVGGGFELALACQVILAVPEVEFALPELARGFIPEAGGLLRVTRRLPHNVAFDLLLTGRRMGAAEALQLGFVSRVVPRSELMSTARAIANQIVAAAPLAVAALMEINRAMEGLPEEEAFRRMRSGLPAHTRMRNSVDFLEGARAFAEKRPPRWLGE
jgi:crotonobetainyl-CoA hydratase